MFSVSLFVEDRGHEVVLRTLVKRLAVQYSVSVHVVVKTATGGHGRVLSKLKEYMSDLENNREYVGSADCGDGWQLQRLPGPQARD